MTESNKINKKEEKSYNKRTWLNRDGSIAAGNVIAFDGVISRWGNKERNTFLQISDCQKSIKLHMTEDDTLEHFIDKMKLLKEEISLFIYHLEQNEIGLKKNN